MYHSVSTGIYASVISGTFARLFSPGGGVFANLALPGGRAFDNLGAIPKLLTRTRFPIRILLHRGYYWKKSRLARLSRTGGCKGMFSILCLHFFIAYQGRIT